MRLVNLTAGMKDNEQSLHDLDMERLLCRIDPSLSEKDALAFLKTYLCTDPNEIRERSLLLGELAEYCSIDEMKQLAGMLYQLPEERRKYEQAEDKLHVLLYRRRRMALYAEAVKALHSAADHPYSSRRMQQLRTYTEEQMNSASFHRDAKLIEKLDAILAFPRTVRMAFNTQQDARASEIGILETGDAENVSPLIGYSPEEESVTGLFPAMRYSSSVYGTHFEEYITTLLEKEWKKPLSKASDLFEKIDFQQEHEIEELADDLVFYCLGMKVIEHFRKEQYPTVRPEILETDDPRMLVGTEMVYPELTFRGTHIHGNPASLLKDGTCIITGANHSGKTSYLKTIGQNLLLAQLGFFAVASRMAFQPVHAFFTLFSAGEDDSMTASRMGIEIRLLAEMLEEARSGDLVLINEPLTSTNPLEAISICSDLLKKFLEMHVPCLMVTHLYDVYFLMRSSLTPELNARMKSLVTRSEYKESEQRMVYDYTLMECDPLGNSYARETAVQYGITLDQMIRSEELLACGIQFCTQEEQTTMKLTEAEEDKTVRKEGDTKEWES